MWPLQAPLLESIALSCDVLAAVQGNISAGAVENLTCKHLLALNVRKVSDAHFKIPRTYYLPARSDCDINATPLYDERASFQADFALSQCISILMKVASLEPSHAEASLAAREVCLAYLEKSKCPWMSQEQWRLLSTSNTSLSSQAAQAGVSGHAVSQEEAERVLELFRTKTPLLQLNLLVNNVWILKPVNGAHGQGISFVVGMCSDGEAIQTDATQKVSFTRRGIGNEQGYVIQKYVERPHLLCPSTLERDDFWCTSSKDACRLSDTIRGYHASGPLHKYSLRFWVDVLWSAVAPEAWFYEAGYVQLANSPYTDALEEPMAHVTNLAQLPADKQDTGASRRPRMYSTQAYRRCLLLEHGRDVFREQLLPQFQRVAACVLGSVQPGGACVLCSKDTATSDKQQWNRLGLDFVVGEDLRVWLLEVNKKPGMGNAKGPQGDMLHALVRQFFSAERLLRAWRTQSSCGDEATRVKQSESLQEDGSINSDPHAYGFSGLDIPEWSRRPL